MAKRRQRTNSRVPAKGRMRDMADKLWSLAVRADWNNRCAVCGVRKVEAHHLVPRRHEATRYDLANGIALCASHHQFDQDISPHQNAAGWLAWLLDHHPRVHEWYWNNRCPTFSGQKNVAYYCHTIVRLQQYVDASEFDRIVGVKFGSYLHEEWAHGLTSGR